MRLSGRAWALVALILLAAGWLAVTTRPRPAVTTGAVPAGVEPPGLKPEQIHALRSERAVDGEHFYIRNLIDGPIQATCSLVEADNVRAEPALPRGLILPAKVEQPLADLVPLDAGRHWQGMISCTAAVGDPTAAAPDGVAYALPFYPGTAFELQQGFNGAASHHDPQSRFALDLSVPEGTPVTAARAGVVMQVEDEFRDHGLDLDKFGDRANYVRVLHDDGSMAVYVHLAPGTALVRPGQRVGVGSFLARSGNTGYTTGPHLHFVVQKNAGMALQSIPFTMAGVDPNAAH